MTAKELYNTQNSPDEDHLGTFDEFISEFEDKWLQYSDVETKIKAYFGSAEEGWQPANAMACELSKTPWPKGPVQLPGPTF